MTEKLTRREILKKLYVAAWRDGLQGKKWIKKPIVHALTQLKSLELGEVEIIDVLMATDYMQYSYLIGDREVDEEKIAKAILQAQQVKWEGS